MALTALSLGVSQLFATQFLVPTSHLMNFTQSFTFTAMIMLCITVPAILMLREPTKKPRRSPQSDEPAESQAAQVEN